MFGQSSNRESGKVSAKVIWLVVGILLVVAVAGQLLGWWAGLLNQGSDLSNLQGSNREQMAALSDEIGASQEPMGEFICVLRKKEEEILGYFNECYGIGSMTEVIENKVIQNGVEVTLKLPGQHRYTPVTLRRGIGGDWALWELRQSVILGDMQNGRSDMTIELLNMANEVVASWDLSNAWVSEISEPMLKDLDGRGFQAGVEEIVIVHEGVTRTK